MSAVELRWGGRADRDDILALRRLAFPGEDVEKQDMAFWEWEFAGSPAGTAHIVVGEAGGRIVGHTAFVPQIYCAGGVPVKGALWVDAMVHPDHQGQRVFPRLAAFASEGLGGRFDASITFLIRRRSIAGTVAGGWSFIERLPVLLRPLSIGNLLRPASRPLPPSPAAIRPIGRSDLVQIDQLLRTSAVRQERTPEFLSWRYLENPAWKYEIDGIFDGDVLQAFAIHRLTTLRGVRSLALVDFGAAPGRQDAFRALLRFACDRARARGAAVAAALVSRNHPAFSLLRRNGFFRGPHRFRFLVKVWNERWRHLHDAPWSLSWGDTDHV